MRPIESPMSKEALDLLQKAQKLLDRVEKAEYKAEYKAAGKVCPCGSGKPQAKCCPDFKKGQPEYETTFNTEPQGNMFVSETAGQTRSAHYTTNQHLLDSQDVANKGTTSQSFSLESLSGKLNPHAGSGVERLTSGGNGPSLQ